MIVVGSIVEIRPAYSSETGYQSVWDEIAGCEAEVLAIWFSDDTVDVRIKNGDETRIAWSRLKDLGAKP